MSDRYTGGILSGTAPTVTQQSANGVYTLSQELQYQGQGVWPAASQNPILQSLRFRASASAYLSRTPASATNQKTWTYSAWVKRAEAVQNDNRLFGAGTSDSNRMTIFIENWIGVVGTNSGSNVVVLNTTAVYRDPSAWYHVIVAVDTTQATSSNRVKIYVNGTQATDFTTATYPSQNTDLYVNSTATHVIGTRGTYAVNSQFDGQMAEINFIDGVQLTPSSFGTTDVNGIWQPIPYTGAYGTNGFYLPFSDIALTSGSNAGLGKDFSGNGNYWNTNNISVTAGSTYDAMKDSPSNASSTIANYCTLNPLDCYDNPPTQGNLARIGVGHTGSPFSTCRGTIGVSSGKWYFEALNTGTTGSSGNNMIGVMTTTTSYLNDAYGGATTSSYQDNGGLQGNNSTGTVSSSGNGDIIMIAFDVDSSKMWVGKNGTWMNSGNPVTGVGYVFSALPISPLAPQVSMYGNVGDTKGWILNFGQQGFTYTPPTGFIALNTYNLPVPTIPAGNKVMDATLWTGNYPSTQTITNSGGFYPDFTWIKGRNYADNHTLWNSVVGAQKSLSSDNTTAETTRASALTAFTSTGFTLGADTIVNPSSSYNVVGWQWNAGSGVSSSNTNGTITSTVSVNTTAGFSVVTYTGTGSAATIGHGLGVAPSMVMTKSRSNNTGDGFIVYHKSLTSASYWLDLATTGTQSGPNSVVWNGTAPTSTVFSVGSATGTNTSGYTYLAYCWAEVAGFSKFGYYGGNLNANGPFVYTGFRPRFLMIKGIDGGGNWYLFDSARDTYNVVDDYLLANSSAAGGTSTFLDFTANGFKIRNAGSGTNDSGISYLYMAFAENPFKIARAR